MRFIRKLSIQRKLIAIITLAASVALLLACSAFVGYELSTLREAAARELETTAQMIGGTSTAALAFGDPKAATETLNTLRSETRIVAACIYSRDGSVLARYARNGDFSRIPKSATAGVHRFQGTRLTIFSQVLLEGEHVGTVYLESDLTEVYARTTRYGFIALTVLALSLLTALAVSSVLQKVISRPLLELAAVAGRVSKDNNYSIRVDRQSEDEIGTLVDSFNEMMGQIHARDLALQAGRDELEDRVADRTHQLQVEISVRRSVEKDLIAAKDAAEASSRAKSVFLANMSHELRTPLNAIIGYSEMLQEDAILFGQTSFVPDLEKIHGAGRHLLSLINDILDLSKIEAGRMELHSERFEIGTLVDEAISTIEPLAKKNHNRLVVRCEDRESLMYTDLVKFRQSLINLLSNACKFTENGTIILDVKPHTSGGRGWFDWEVSDTGPGIAPEHMHKLFKSFSQVDGSATRKHGGTGLGLAISRKLCEMMGGTIFAESHVGQGSKFTIRLPAGPVEAPVTPSPEIPRAPAPPPESRLVLVIDDDDAVQDLLQRSLAKHGFEVLSASNGRQGLDMARQHRPFAIILDILMPDLDGWTVFRTLRSEPAFAQTPVLFHSITENRSLGAELGAAEFLQKPVAVEHLVAVLNKHTRGGTGAGKSVSDLLKTDCPHLFEPGASFSALARIAEVTDSHISLDLKLAGDSGRELFDELSRSEDWQRLAIVRLGSQATLPDQMAGLAIAVRSGTLPNPEPGLTAADSPAGPVAVSKAKEC